LNAWDDTNSPATLFHAQLIPDYVAAPSYSLDPRPTLLWLANVNLFARVLSLPIDHPSGIALPPAPLLGSATAEHEEEERDAENWAVKAAEQGTSAVVSCDWLRSNEANFDRRCVGHSGAASGE
jgi:hypothetical protein